MRLDLLFQRSKKAGNYGKKITYEEFRTVAFPAIALKKDVSQADLAEIVIRLGQRGDAPYVFRGTNFIL